MTKFQLAVILGIVVPLLLCQAVWIFKDAKKRNEKHYWLWGLFGLVNVPESLLIYLLVTRIIIKKFNKKYRSQS